MQLFEGAKITQQILRQAMSDPGFTFGFEVEFFLEGANQLLQNHMTQGLGTTEHDGKEFFVKKLGDVIWHDVTYFFKPLGVKQNNSSPNRRILEDRLADVYESQLGEDAQLGNPDVMWDALKHKLGIHVLMTAMRIYPDGHIVGLPENQEKALRDIVYDGDTEEIQPFGKLRDVKMVTVPVGADAYNMWSEDGLTAFFDLVAKDLSSKLGTEVGYHWNDDMVYHVGGYKTWVVTADTSLEEEMESNYATTRRDLGGVELVSPIMNVQKGIAMLRKVLEIMNGAILGLNVVTTQNTGLHINLGVRNKEIDPVKILVLAGDEHILNKFDRASSDYAASVQSALKDRMATVAGGEIPKGMDAKYLIHHAQEALRGIETDQRDIDRVIAVLNDIKPEGKSHSINFEKLPSGYVEYRSLGNAGYEKREQEIMDAVLQMIGITYIATDPNVYRKEFLKKLYSMVQQSVASTDVSQDVTLAASVGPIGYGPRGGYGQPAEKSPPTPYDGENLITKFGFDSGSDTQ